ncbi:ArdC-like ssDNA-binding domain-containing protein [Leifsonia sp. TF02-11]|uniref:ArdC-like ssDNA-binding domain-containing protein n=1 Tax=Leifsonia sp. TF02-11 TaxID=2815212 RepID=UPI001AA1BA43|nr:ArdC-like ssDNA-binding domain-containing protein [Leifsonia sp. TF02-11]MBO1741765.1 DUF1738 domain-containing protein [Leifsonia sp. TF02-11]
MSGKVITRNPQERHAEAEALHASIVEQVQRLAESGQWRAFLEFARSFHNYSLNNLLLILAQKPEATMVAGFRQWQAKGRQVRKGEKAIKIFGFREKKTESTTESGSETPAEEHTVRYFPTLSVFDITQTDPIEGADPLPEDPARQLTGDDDHGVIRPLTAHLETHGWSVHRVPLTRANGHTDPETKKVSLAENLATEQSAKTLLHETAHIELHHIDDLDKYRTHRGRLEVEAESGAYIVAGLAGFDTSAYSIGYIAGWAEEDVTVIRETAKRVLQAAHTIAEILENRE